MTFEEVQREHLAGMIAKRNLLNRCIAQLEETLSQPPYKSNLDHEEIQFMAEHDIVQFDLMEQERDAARAKEG